VKESAPPAASPARRVGGGPKPSGFRPSAHLGRLPRDPSFPTKEDRAAHEQSRPAAPGARVRYLRRTADYIAAPELMQTVNVAMTLSRPLLIKGEPRTGKTMLAQSIARGLDMALIAWNIKSTTKARTASTSTTRCNASTTASSAMAT